MRAQVVFISTYSYLDVNLSFFFGGGVHIIDVCNPLFISNIDKSRNTGTQILKFKFLFFYIDSKSYLVFIF